METIAQNLLTLADVLKHGLKGSAWNILIPTITAFLSVILGAFVGRWLTDRSENKRALIKNHKKFLEDFTNYYAKIHALYQEIFSYNKLLCHLGFQNYVYDFSKAHFANAQNAMAVEKEYKNFKATNAPGTNPNKEKYWEIVLATNTKILDFDLIIALASSMNETAQVSVLFVAKPIKQAFDLLIEQTHVLSQNNLVDFNLHEYRLQLIAIMQLIRNEIDPNKESIYFRNQRTIFNEDDSIRLSYFSNYFTVIKVKKNKVICKDAKNKKYIFFKQEVEKF